MSQEESISVNRLDFQEHFHRRLISVLASSHLKFMAKITKVFFYSMLAIEHKLDLISIWGMNSKKILRSKIKAYYKSKSSQDLLNIIVLKWSEKCLDNWHMKNVSWNVKSFNIWCINKESCMILQWIKFKLLAAVKPPKKSN